MSCTSAKVDDNNASEKKNKNYVGWVDSTAKDITYKDGAIYIRVKQNLGTFNIGVINSAEKTIPVLSTNQEFTTSPLYLKTSKKTYTLRNDGYIKTYASRTKNVISMHYQLDKKFEVVVDFEFYKSSEDTHTDMLKVTYTVTNLSDKKDDFALKAIYDTVLGESDSYHFYTSENLPIKNEVSYRTMQNQKWFTSKNKNAAMQFLLNGADTTAPELVALANYSTFQKNSWEPEMLSYRAFDTVLSYNNSAVGILWPSIKLNPQKSYKNVFYLAFATDGEEPCGHNYIFKPEEVENVDTTETQQKVDLNPAQKVVEPTAEIPTYYEQVNVVPIPSPVETVIIEEIPEIPLNRPAEEKKSAKVEEKNLDSSENDDDLLGGLKPEQLTPDYIQQLIDRITELENDSSTVNAQEIIDLNTELDLILSVLR